MKIFPFSPVGYIYRGILKSHFQVTQSRANRDGRYKILINAVFVPLVPIPKYL
jgi:hypothetical protein